METMDALVEIKRFEHDTDKANRGIVFLDGDFFGFSLECPAKGNQVNISRINPGEYTARKMYTEKRGNFWLLDNANERTEIILFHKGSLLKDFKGCVGLGAEIGKIQGERAIFDTNIMCRLFRDYTFKHKTMKVIIT